MRVGSWWIVGCLTRTAMWLHCSRQSPSCPLPHRWWGRRGRRRLVRLAQARASAGSGPQGAGHGVRAKKNRPVAGFFGAREALGQFADLGVQAAPVAAGGGGVVSAV